MHVLRSAQHDEPGTPPNLAVRLDHAQTVAPYPAAAEHGGAYVQGYLGWMYAEGRGVPHDDAEAVAWYRRAAEQGDAVAQYSLGEMYAHGRGVKRDDTEAVDWYRKAAAQGYSTAQIKLAVLLEDIDAFARNQRMAEHGDAVAQYTLGEMYANGRGTPRDDAKAVEWYRRAAAQGDAIAQYSLFEMYVNGRGDSPRFWRVRHWLGMRWY